MVTGISYPGPCILYRCNRCKATIETSMTAVSSRCYCGGHMIKENKTMIISASRRTDLPAFYPEETIKNIIKLCNENKQLLTPSPIPQHGVVFWTKNPDPIIPYLHQLDNLNIVYYFQYTLNDYPELEPNVPSLDNRIDTYNKLGKLIGYDKIKIRFDPILVSSNPPLPIDTVLNRYYEISQLLSMETKDITFSFVDYYPKLPQRIKTLTQSEINYAIQFFIDKIGDRYNLYSCAESISNPYIKPNRCIDPDVFISMGMKLPDINEKDKTQRLLCKCYPSKDIGEYRSCKHKCVYCYAK
jgi:DNA repair photolyase